MIIVRTATETDLESVFKLAQQAYPGMTTLPPDHEVLSAKLSNSIASIAKKVDQPGEETYFMVMEDTENQRVVGTAAVIACLGTNEDFYSYKLNKVTHSSRELGKKVTVNTLNLSNHYEGYSEVATLYLDEDYRRGGNGKLLATTRYLFMAQFRSRFPQSVMADLRGSFDENGDSPFWDAVGAHFFEMSFSDADLHCGVHGNQFISDLMPKQPIYVNLLPKVAQEVIGQPNPKGVAAMKMLEKEGFRWNGYVDIFDAAPSVDCHIDDVAAVKNSHVAELIGISEHDGDGRAMIATQHIENFKTCISNIAVEKGGVYLPRDVIKGMELEIGDSVRYLLL